jgi:hypothetical protein
MKKEANLTAHVIAKAACNSIDSIWWHRTPSCINDIIMKDEVSNSM